jgi:hypothetical protein
VAQAKAVEAAAVAAETEEKVVPTLAMAEWLRPMGLSDAQPLLKALAALGVESPSDVKYLGKPEAQGLLKAVGTVVQRAKLEASDEIQALLAKAQPCAAEAGRCTGDAGCVCAEPLAKAQLSMAGARNLHGLWPLAHPFFPFAVLARVTRSQTR